MFVCVCVCVYIHSEGLYVCVCVCVCVCVIIIPFGSAGCERKSIFKQIISGLNLMFSFSLTSWHTVVNYPSQPKYLPITNRKIFGCTPFLRLLALYKIQTLSPWM